MRKQTSINFSAVAPSAYGSRAIHHKPEQRAKLQYIHHELTVNNERWDREFRPDGSPKTLANYLAEAKKRVKEKTGYKMQKKAEEKFITEGVVNCDAEVTMDDLKRLANRLEEQWGWTCVQIHMHRDEGYNRNNMGLNLHAHIYFETTNRETGKSFKRPADAGKIEQDITAEALGMLRGTPKEKTGKKHLNIIDYKVKVQEERAKKLESENETVGKEVAEARKTHTELTKSNKELENNNTTLEEEISQKQTSLGELETKIENIDEELKQKATKGVVAFVANTFGSQETKYKKRKKNLEKIEADISEKKAELEYYSVKVEEISKQGDLSEDIDKAVKALESIPAGTTIRTVEVKPSEAVRELIRYKPEVYNTLTDWVAVIQDLRTLHVKIEKWKLEVGEEHNYKALWVAKPYDGEVKVQIQQDKENGKVYVAVKDTIQNEWQRVMDWVKNIVQKATERLREGLETLKKVAEEIENKPKRSNLKDLPSVKSGLNDKIREAFGDNRPKLEDMASYVGLKKDKEETQQQSRGRKL